MREGIEGRARIRVRIEPAAAFGADAAPLAGEQGAAEQVGPDLQPVEAPFVPLGPDTDQAGGLRKQRQLDRGGWTGPVLRRLGINSRELYHFEQSRASEKVGMGQGRVELCYTINYSVSDNISNNQPSGRQAPARLDSGGLEIRTNSARSNPAARLINGSAGWASIPRARPTALSVAPVRSCRHRPLA